ncbi:hypothetical protein FH972_018103 [Carpinus fangiana]|uniref:Uncharacterized protein n=1 Tax=Carpinus fangiana TaxID=176857 RepID=A0A5N6RLF6_9ROSI|nr:hypothetical protein FH972_018103 [Carpinus fangiana]
MELLIGINVAPSTRSKKRINVVKYFLRLLKENQLFELLDCDIVEEGNKEQIKEVVKLAERCLRLKGDERPTVEELKNELEGIRKTKLDAFIG